MHQCDAVSSFQLLQRPPHHSLVVPTAVLAAGQGSSECRVSLVGEEAIA